MLCARTGASWLIAARVVRSVVRSRSQALRMLLEFPPSRRGTPIGIAGATGSVQSSVPSLARY